MLSEVQRLLVDALHATDAVERLRVAVAAAPRDALGDDERAWLLSVNDDGFRVASLLVRKLRFERALRGDPALRDAFERSPGESTATWRAYERHVAPAAEDAAGEAAAFGAWRASTRNGNVE